MSILVAGIFAIVGALGVLFFLHRYEDWFGGPDPKRKQ